MMTDHEGTQWNTKREMCEHWNITPSRFSRNINKGMNLETALTIPPVSNSEAGRRGRASSGWARGNEFLIGRNKSGS